MPDVMRAWTPRRYALVVGGFLLLQGVFTLLFRLYEPLDRAFPALLAITQMIPPHSLLHIVTGVLAVAVLLLGGIAGAWWYALLFGVFYTALGIVAPLTGMTFGLGLQPFDHPFHLVVGVPGLLAAAVGPRRAERATA